MEIFSALLDICAGNSPVIGEFPTQRPVTRSFDVFFDLRLNKRLSKQSWVWWFETPSRPLWRHCNDKYMLIVYLKNKPEWHRWRPTCISILLLFQISPIVVIKTLLLGFHRHPVTDPWKSIRFYSLTEVGYEVMASEIHQRERNKPSESFVINCTF